VNKPLVKNELHPRNAHRGRYDFKALVAACPELSEYLTQSPSGDHTINFANPKAVLWLNKALLKSVYGLQHWDLPANYLCPPIPGRADYIHYLADLLASTNKDVIPTGANVRVLDIGVGANCVYPIIGHKVYGWQFVGSDIDPIAVKHAQSIVDQNDSMSDDVFIRLQPAKNSILQNIIHPAERFDLALCNPPFHSSAAEAREQSMRKTTNLSGKRTQKPVLNFGGTSNELWCDGGEKEFINRMVDESTHYRQQCLWFTSLVSKQTTLASVHNKLKEANVVESRIIEMAQGQKISRFVVWTFLTPLQRKEWSRKRWS
jgi:23S rRNA (adenine1618-N6)-methyltransferase